MTTVLLFEHDPSFASELEQAFRARGWQSTIVDSGAQGLQLVTDMKPDLIVVSAELPKMNGFSLCNKIRRDGKLRSIPLVVTSSESTPETFRQHSMLPTRADLYVHKPVALDELLKAVDEILPMNIDDAQSIAVSATESAVVSDVVSNIVDVIADPASDTRVGEATAIGEGTRSEERIPSAPPQHEDVPTSPPSGASASAQPHAADDGEVSELVRAAIVDEYSEAERYELELQRYRRQNEELQRQLAERGTAAPAAGEEFLRLRGALNDKEKEVWELQEALTQRDKELLRLREQTAAVGKEKSEQGDRLLAGDRARAELEQRLRQMQEELAEREDKQQILAGRHEKQLRKQAEDHSLEIKAVQQRAERILAEELEKLVTEWTARLDRTHTDAQRQMEAREQAHRDELVIVTRASDERLRVREQELTEGSARSLAEVQAARDEALRRADEQRTAEIGALSDRHSAELDELRGTHTRELGILQQAHGHTLEAERAEWSRVRGELEESARSATEALELERNTVQQLRSELSASEHTRSAVAAQLTSVEAAKSDLAAQWRRAVDRAQQDKVLLGHAVELVGQLHSRLEELQANALVDSQQQSLDLDG